MKTRKISTNVRTLTVTELEQVSGGSKKGAVPAPSPSQVRYGGFQIAQG